MALNNNLNISQILLNKTEKNSSTLLTEQVVDRFENDHCQVSVIGYLRVYNQANRIDAKHLASLYEGDISALYEKIAGQFIVFIYDKQTRKLLVFNDHMATMPCYYYQENGKVWFSSSLQYIKNIASNELLISNQAIFNYCYFHCIPAPTTIYQSVFKLDSSELVVIEQDSIEHKGSLYRPHFSQKSTMASAHHDCLNTVKDMVAFQNDDPNIGAFLSGGLDSSTVAGVLSELKIKQGNKAKTFSIGFKEQGYDETSFAELSAKHFNTEHKTSYLPPEYISENFVKVASAFDEPFGNSSALAAYYCASFAKEHGVSTLLAGDGGDEIFAGNSRYAKQKLFRPFELLPRAAQSFFKQVFLNTPLNKMPVAKKVASYIEQADTPLPDRLQSYNFLHRFSPNEIFTADFLKDVDQGLPLEQLRARYQQSGSSNAIDSMLYMDWKFTLADNDLIKVSKMCAMAGVKVKFPLLEKELVDFSCQIPASEKLPGNKLRDFFKKSMKNFLADETLSKPKHGFGLPFGRWMRTTPSLVSLTEQSLQDLKKRNIIQETFIDKALDMQKNEHSAYYGELIWILTVLELWFSQRVDK
jgi:asparagine synthase (glutamine-hydrolysing)